MNKTENNVQLVHKPTGLRVACQETRSLTQNRKIARKILLDKVQRYLQSGLCVTADNRDLQLDKLYNPGLSKSEMERAKKSERARRRKKKAKRKAGEKDDDSDVHND